MQYNSTQFQTGEELDDFLALVKEKIKNMGGGSGTLTKEQIEQVLTGNIETHSHDTRYSYAGPEIDEWDGISVSEALDGSGSEQNPYLIQSCADYVHFIKTPLLYSMTDSQPKVIKITKNLDFGNHEIDMDGFFDYSVTGDTSNIFLNGVLVDGGGMILSNLNLKNAWSVFPQSLYSKFHDIHIRNANLHINGSAFNDDATQQFLSLIRGVAGFGSVYNVSITGVLHINGDINPTGEIHILTIYSDAHIDSSTEEIKSSSFSSLDVQFENTTLTEDGNNAVLLVLSNIPGSVTYTTSQTTYSESNVYSAFAYAIESTTIAYADPAKTTVIPMGSDSHLINKTWSEMKSDGFIDLLNSYQDVFSKDFDNVNNGFPVFKQGTSTLEYDGYVKESEFNAKIRILESKQDSPFVDILLSSIAFPGDGDYVYLSKDEYDAVVSGLKDGKILRVKAGCGIFFGFTSIMFNSSDYNNPDFKYSDSLPYIVIDVSSFGDKGEDSTDPTEKTFIRPKRVTVNLLNNPDSQNRYKAVFKSDSRKFVLGTSVHDIVSLSQGEYDNLTNKDINTLYIIH